MGKLRIMLWLVLTLLGYSQVMRAQGTLETEKKQNRWYIGGDVGVSFGSATFNSFGGNKTRVGYNLGILGGYHINSYLSAESELHYTHLGMETLDCCQNLWFGADGNRYFAPLAGQQNWKLGELFSLVNLYRLGVRLNMDLLQLFRPDSRWSVLLSPTLSGVGTMAKIKTISNEALIDDSSMKLRFGVGGDLGVGYQVGENLNVRLYTGITYLTGKGMDALPQVEHKTNFIWDSGVKVTFAFGKKVGKRMQKVVDVVSQQPVMNPLENKKQEEETQPSDTFQPIKPVESDTKEVSLSVPDKVIYETSIYFSLNQCKYIESSQYKVIGELLKSIEQNPEATITIVGYADKTGTQQLNERISACRAETIKRYLVRKGIAVDRITARGDGVDAGAMEDNVARRAEIKLIVTEK